MIVMFAFGRYRGRAWDALFVSAVSLAIAAIPEALPTVTQVILSLRQRRAGQAQRHRQGPALGRDARVHVGHQLRQDRHPDHEPDDRRRGHRPRRPLHHQRHRLRPRGPGRARGRQRPKRSRTPSCRTSSPTTPSWSTARSSATPPRGRCWCWPTRPAWTSTAPASGCPGWPRCRSTRPTS